MTRNIAPKHWLNSGQAEEVMQEKHLPIWRTLIERILEQDLSTATVLDFGCNRGGFLRELYRLRPFAKGIGVDIAENAISLATESVGELPLEFLCNKTCEIPAGPFDLVTSYDVIYLLEDLVEHAREIYDRLATGGVYYATTGVFTENPLFSRWKPYLEKGFGRPIPERSASDTVKALRDAGFQVSVRRLAHEDYSFVKLDSPYFFSLFEEFEYNSETTLIFRCQKS